MTVFGREPKTVIVKIGIILSENHELPISVDIFCESKKAAYLLGDLHKLKKVIDNLLSKITQHQQMADAIVDNFWAFNHINKTQLVDRFTPASS